MNLLLLLIVLMLVFSGLGFHVGGPVAGNSVITVFFIVLVVLLVAGKV